MTIFGRTISIHDLGRWMLALGLALAALSIALTVLTRTPDSYGSGPAAQFLFSLLVAVAGAAWPLIQAGALLLAADLIAERIRPTRS